MKITITFRDGSVIHVDWPQSHISSEIVNRYVQRMREYGRITEIELS